MAVQPAHSRVDPQEAVKHLSADPGLPIDNPLPALWQEPPAKLIAKLRSNLLPQGTDVVIIGSGITGASVARHLLQQDDQINVVMLEARTITSGATGRNGGHIMVQPELFYAGVAGAHGKEKAKEYVNFALANQDALFDLAKVLPPSLVKASELRQLEILHVLSSEVARSNCEALTSRLKSEFGEVQRSLRLISKEEMSTKYDIHNSHGGAIMLAGAAWPYRLIAGILTGLWQDHGKRFFIETETPAKSITWSDETQRYSVETPRGIISAKHVVHATNAYAGHLIPSVRGFVHPLSCQVTVQEQAPGSINRGSELTHVITVPTALNSVYQSPQTGDIYVSGLVGVSDFFEEFTPRDDKNNEAVIADMATILNRTYGTPTQGRTKANWTGIMGWTADGMPLVGKIGQDLTGRSGGGEYIAAGYNGVGMVTAWLSGEHIADTILEKSEPRKIPAIFHASKERVEKAPLEGVLKRTYGTWE